MKFFVTINFYGILAGYYNFWIPAGVYPALDAGQE
jgi:hypothetical protein